MSNISKPDANPMVSALLCLVLDLGHFINGQQRKWIYILVANIVGNFLCFLPGLFIWVLSIMDAHATALRLQAGESIPENEYSNPMLFKIMKMFGKTATCSKA